MSFSPPVVGCLLKERLTKGGHGHPSPPLLPGYAPGVTIFVIRLKEDLVVAVFSHQIAGVSEWQLRRISQITENQYKAIVR